MNNLYLLENKVNNDYTSIDGAVVVAPDEETARMIHPDGRKNWNGEFKDYLVDDWCGCSDVVVTKIGTAENRYETGKIIIVQVNDG